MLSIEKYEKSINLENLMSKNDINELILRDFQKGKTINIELSSNISYKSELTNDGEDLTFTFNDNAQTFKIVLKGMVEILNSNDGSDLIKLIQTDTENTYSISDLASALEASAAGGEIITQGDGTQNSTQNNELTFDNTPTLAGRLDINNELTQNGSLPLFVNLNQNNDETGISSIIYSGKLIDGYIAGSTVFIDTNNNGSLDVGENSTTTDANGDFSFTGLTQIELDAGPIVAFGGTDISTGLPFEGFYSAPNGSTTVSPLSTLIHELVEDGLTESEAEDLIATTFGLDTNIDLLNYDPIQEQNPQVQIVAVQIANLVNLSAALFSNLEGGSEADASLLAFDYLAQILQDNPQFDLSNSADIETFMREITNDNLNLDFDGISSSIANINVQVEESVNALDPFATMAEIQRVQVENLENEFTSNEAPVATEESNIVEENDLNDVTIGGTEIVDYNFTGSVAGNATDINGDDIEYSYVGNLNISLSTTNMAIVSELNNPSPEFTQVLKTYFLEIVSNPLVSAVIDDSQKLQEIEAYLLDPTTTINDALTYLNNLAPVNINLTTGEFTIEGVISEKYVNILQTNNALIIDVQSDGTYTLNSPYFNLLTPNEKLEISFDYQATDGILVDSSTISLTVNGGNEAPVITVEDPMLAGLSESDFAENSSGIPNYYKIISLEEVYNLLGVEDVDDVSLTVSLDDGNSTFTINGIDISTDNTNGVFQLRDGIYDSNWANQGANENDIVIFSEEIDSLDENQTMNITFDVKAYDGTDFSEAKTVSVAVSGENDIPVITVEDPMLAGLSESDFAENSSGIPNYYKIISLEEVYNLLGVEDVDDVSLTVSLDDGNSTFTINGIDISTDNTNGVFQLRDGIYDSNWANQGANENDIVIFSEEIDSLDENQTMNITFDVKAYDGTDFSEAKTVSVAVSGENDIPVITVEDPMLAGLSESDFAENSSGIPNYYKIISLEEVYNLLGVEDVDDVSLTVSLDDGNSTFTINGIDISTDNTNGVFQLRDGIYDSNWANQGANENDIVIFSEEIDSLDENQTMNITFDVKAYDGTDFSEAKTVSVAVSGENDIPVITVEDPMLAGLSESDFAENSSGIPNYYKIISLEEVYNLLGVEDVDDVSLTVSLDDGNSTFTINGIDISTDNTNGVFQLRDGIYDSNWANQGANENDIVIFSEEIDSLDENQTMNITFDVKAYDGTDFSEAKTVSVAVSGENDIPVITVEDPMLAGLSESDFAENSSGIPNYYKIISLEEVYNLLGVEDVDDVSLTVSLDDGNSTFTINGIDISTDNTNGVFQLRDGIYDSNWANQGANENDIVIFSEEIDSLDENQTMNITFDVKAYDGTDFSEAKTVSVAVSGENDIPVITVEDPMLAGLSESDFAENSSGIPNYYKIISLEEVYNLLGVEDVDDVSLTVSLDDGNSTFTINGIDISTDNTNGVFQLRDGIYDSNWANQGANENDIVIFSEEIDSLDENQTMNITFDVKAYDGTDFSEAKTVSVAVSGDAIDVRLESDTLYLEDDAGRYSMADLLGAIPENTQVESIDLSYTGEHILSNISVEDFLAISDDNTLIINKDSDDSVNLDSNIWSSNGNTSVGGIDYDTYIATDTSTSNTLTLLIEQDPIL